MSNVWGILILGAAGSVIGTILFLVAKKVVFALFPAIVKKFKELSINAYLWIIKKSIKEHISLYLKTSPSRHQAYYATLVGRLIIGLFVSSWLIYTAISTYGNDNLWLTVILISISLLVVGGSLRNYLCLSATWNFDFESKVEETANKAIKEIVDEVIAEKLD
jgi:hypothetical protein